MPQKPQCVVLRQTVTLSRKPENLLGRYRLLPSIVTTAPSIPVYGMLRGPDSGCLAGHPLAASACGTNAKSPPHRGERPVAIDPKADIEPGMDR